MSGRSWITISIIVTVVAIWIYVIFVPPPQLPIGAANGTYSHVCCETIKLNNGEMRIGNQLVSYVIESDKAGPYVLTSEYVGVLDGSKFEISPNKFPLKMSFDDSAHPTAIEIMSPGGTYRFARVSGKTR